MDQTVTSKRGTNWRPEKYLSSIIIFILVSVLYLTGALEFIEFKLTDLRFQLSQRDASQDIVLVEIDPVSLDAIGVWPWPRGLFAAALDKLLDAGARRVAIAVDFSTLSHSDEDQLFAQALSRSQSKAILPIFKQHLVSPNGLQRLKLSVPLADFRDHAALAFINVRPESDGLIRKMMVWETWDNWTFPSLAAALAETSNHPFDSYFIDYGIRISSIPRISFVDILQDRFDHTRVNGKLVLIGNTAVELGDQLSVPVHKALSGALVQILAYESLFQKRTLQHLEPVFVLIPTLILSLILGTLFARWAWRRSLTVTMIIFFIAWTLTLGVQSFAPLLIDITPLLLVTLLTFAMALTRKIDQQWSIMNFQKHLIHRKDKIMRNLVEGSFDGIIVFNENGIIDSINPAATEMFESLPDGLIGEKISMVLPRLNEMPRGEGLYTCSKAGQKPYETLGRRMNGNSFTVEAVINEIHIDGQTILTAFLRDITEQKLAEEQLRHSQRLDAVGQLTGGIAHDFNNLLAIMIGNADLLLDSVGDDEEAKQSIEAIKAAVDRGASLTNRLLAFSRKQMLSPSATAINGLVLGLEDMLQRTLGETVELRTHLGPGICIAQIDVHQFENALVNLALNARDAMPRGGVLTIETANVILDETYAEQHEEVTPGDYVEVLVSDTGTGMSPEILEKVFEPFFTTKEVGKGSGLGLSMVFGFAKQSKGHITIYSEVGQGTTVKLYMPQSEENVAKVGIKDATREVARGSERILLIEDDEHLRKVSVKILRKQGYAVVEAADGKEAIKHLTDGQPFDLLFTDVVLPGGMSGVEIAEEARRIQPGINILYTTGYSENAVLNGGQLDHGVTLLNKPYGREELLAKVFKTLDRGDD